MLMAPIATTENDEVLPLTFLGCSYASYEDPDSGEVVAITPDDEDWNEETFDLNTDCQRFQFRIESKGAKFRLKMPFPSIDRWLAELDFEPSVAIAFSGRDNPDTSTGDPYGRLLVDFQYWVQGVKTPNWDDFQRTEARVEVIEAGQGIQEVSQLLNPRADMIVTLEPRSQNVPVFIDITAEFSGGRGNPYSSNLLGYLPSFRMRVDKNDPLDWIDNYRIARE